MVIEDDIWFENKDSEFYSYINKDIEYEYYYSEKRDYIRYPDIVYILPLIEQDKSLSHLYHVLELNILEGRLIIPYTGSNGKVKLSALGKGVNHLMMRTKKIF